MFVFQAWCQCNTPCSVSATPAPTRTSGMVYKWCKHPPPTPHDNTVQSLSTQRSSINNSHSQLPLTLYSVQIVQYLVKVKYWIWIIYTREKTPTKPLWYDDHQVLHHCCPNSSSLNLTRAPQTPSLKERLKKERKSWELFVLNKDHSGLKTLESLRKKTIKTPRAPLPRQEKEKQNKRFSHQKHIWPFQQFTLDYEHEEVSKWFGTLKRKKWWHQH